jgi:phospho-N-acetylmuramoyl-pentapeptide-transferase
MLYYLTNFREHFRALNLFQYITFRAGGAALTSLTLSLLMGPGIIAALKRRRWARSSERMGRPLI